MWFFYQTGLVERHCILGALVIIASVTLSTNVEASVACPKPRAIIEIDSRSNPPVLDHSLSKSRLQALGNSKNTYGKGSIIGGLYRAEHRYDLDLKQKVGTHRGQNCTSSVSVVFKHRLNQTIFIPTNYARRSCQFNAVYAHEIQHSDFEETAFKVFQPKFKRAIEKDIRRYGHLSVDALTKQMTSSIDQVFRDFDLDRTRRHQTIDNPEAYARDRRRCSEW